MSLNEEFVAKEEVVATKSEEKKKKKLTPRKKMKIYYSIFGAFLAVVVIIGALMTYQALTYVVGVFSDYSMAPLINKEIKDKDGKVYTYENFSDRDGNIVEYGLINPAKNIKEYKRFDVVAIQEYKDEYFFEPFRVVGLPGETIKLDYDGNLFVNGEEVKQPIDKEFLKLDWSKYDYMDKDNLYYQETLGEGEYYLLKDNRYYYNDDSRLYGPYVAEDIYGKVIGIQGTCTLDCGYFINCSIPFTRYI